MIIMKFGGVSQSSGERLCVLARLIQMRPSVVVLSAIGTTTDLLLEAGQKALSGQVDYRAIFELHRGLMEDLSIDVPDVMDVFKELEGFLSTLKHLGQREEDHLMSFGERISVRLCAAYLNSIGVKAHFYDAWDVGFITTSEHGNAELIPGAKIEVPLDKGIPLITGFIGKDMEGNITTFGRGGSDLTASYLAEALHAEEIWLWKDVDGVMTADPRFVKTAQLIKELSFEEALELSHFGAKVFHPKSMLPAMRAGIPVRVKNAIYPDREGTTVVTRSLIPPVRAIAHRSDHEKVRLTLVGQNSRQALEKATSVLWEKNIEAEMMAHSSSLMVSKDFILALQTLHKCFFEEEVG